STTASIAVDGQGGTGPYAYAWSSGQQVSTLNGVLPGSYTVTVSDAQGCTLAQTFVVQSGGAPFFTGNQLTPVACFGENTGQIAVQTDGGVAPYQFNWSTGAGGALLPDLPAGDYALTVTDANGCSTTAGFTVVEPPPLFLQAQVDSTDCSSTTASIAVDGQGGTGPYAYAWSGGQQVSALNDVLPGTYTVTVSDAQGCALAQTFVVQSGGAPFFTGNQLTPVACFGENTGQIAVQTDGGVAPYQFTWSTGAGGALLPDLPAGDYALTVTDANGCSTTAGFTVTEPPPLALSILPDAVPCAGMTGGLAAIVQGGTPGYAYAWDAGFSDQHPTGLPAGQYAVTVTDSSGCSISTDFLLPEPPPLNVQGTISPVLCTQPGSISVDIQGGTAPYAYAWNTGHVEPVLDGLTAGAFTVTVSDANGCSSAQVFTLVAPAVPLVSDTVLTPVRCFGESSGEIQIALESGTPPYQIQWSNGSTGTSVSGLSAGTYTATVTDSGACSFTVTLNLTQPEVLEASALTIADTCQRQTGAIDLSVTGGVLPYGLLWSDGQTTDDRQSLAAGNWAFTLTDGHGCVFSQTVAVPAVEIQPVFSLSADTVTCTRPLAGLEVVPAPGSWFFQWKTPGGNLLNGGQQNVGVSGTYQVTVTNAEGCSVAQSINVVADTVAPQANIATAGIVYIPCDQAPVLLVGSSTSAGPDIETGWFLQSNGQNNWDTLATSIVANIPGIYLFQVLDNGNGCKTTDTVELQLLPGIDALALEVDSVSCFGLRDAEIRVDSVTGGVPPYSYSIDQQPFGANTVFPGLGAGTYAIAVQDVEGCTFETNVILAQPDSFYVTLDASGTTLSEGQSLLLKAQVLPPGFAWANIEWFPPGLFANPLLLTQLVKPAETTQFEIVVSDQQGCTAAAGVLVQVEQTGVYLPNAIYSGRPGNGVFTVFAGADVEMVHLLRIFDRWGELLFERRDFSPNDPAQGWDGTFRGDAVAPGVYVYYLVIRLANGNELELRGDVTVFR
ncbi:MAG: gliding motility-associated C-terminal domain-containing protein, partial [Saprospiraceae bacterium]|nr:gliding motility-associated C-terminal domain-containing protein [Saprospiraceae bacterium]